MATTALPDVSIASPAAERIHIGTWLRFLAGGREAIVQIARSRQALWLGLVFVLSTGFAREYDGADLLREPWHLVLPLVASLGTSLVLWSLVYLAAGRRGLDHLEFWPGYRTLLTFYWMTAPLAWIYAIPVEQLMSPGEATATNFWFLALVSVWRVLLITRAISVWLNANFFAVFFLVALFADSVAGILALASPLPIFNVMGGVRHSEVDGIVLNALMTTRIYGVLSWPVWLIGAIVVLVRKSSWTLPDKQANDGRVSAWLWAFAAALIVAGVALLPLGQSQQQHASTAARLLRANKIAAALEYLGKLQRSELPPIWDPPPRIGYGENTPQVIDVLEEIGRKESPDWIRAVYVEKLQVDPRSSFESAFPWGKDFDSQRLERILSLYEKFVPGDSLEIQQREDLIMLMESRPMDVELRKRMSTYLKWPSPERTNGNSSEPATE